MADYRSVKCGMWAGDEWFIDLDVDAKLLWVYLFTNAHTSVAGIYKLPRKTIHNETGIDLARVDELLGQFSNAGKAHYQGGVVWVVTMREHQATSSDLVKKRITKDLALLPDSQLKRRYYEKYGTDTVSIPYLQHASDTDTDTDTELGGVGGAPQAPAAKAASELPTDAEWAAAFQGFEAAIGRVTSGYTLQEMRETFDELRAANRLDWWQAAIDETMRCEGNSWTYMARVIDGSTKRGMKPGERRVNGGRQAYEDRKSADYKLKMAILLGDDSGITADGGLGAWPSIGRVS